jgi:hypothetical protein
MGRAQRTARILAAALAVQVALVGDAQAYLDPGAGSFIFQAIVAMLLGAAFTVKMYWRRLKGFFSGKPQPAADTCPDPEAQDGDAG